MLYVNDFHVFAGILGIWALWRTIRVAHARHVSQSQTQFLRQLIREQEWLRAPANFFERRTSSEASYRSRFNVYPLEKQSGSKLAP